MKNTRMFLSKEAKEQVKNEILNLIEKNKLNFTIEEFEKKNDWMTFSRLYKNEISENFVIMYKHRLYWSYISHSKTLSDEFKLKFINFPIIGDWIKMFFNNKFKLGFTNFPIPNDVFMFKLKNNS